MTAERPTANVVAAQRTDRARSARLPSVRRPGAILLAAAVTAISLSGCGAGAWFGGDKRPPDEFTVFSRAPLSVPPDYGLRPPGAATASQVQASPEETARRAVSGSSGQRATSAVGDPTLSPGTRELLTVTGAGRADPNIRAQLESENALLNDQDLAFTERLMFWKSNPAPGQVVDAPAETRRVQESLAQGQPVNTGQTPIIQRRQRALLEGIF